MRVELDHAPFGTMARETVAAEQLQLGSLVDAALRERLEAAADAEAAYRTALRALERRAYASADLGRRLARKGHPAGAVRTALERAASAGLLDDAEFVLDYVQTRSARGRGPSRLTRDLLAMGIERRLIDRALSTRGKPRPSDHADAPGPGHSALEPTGRPSPAGKAPPSVGVSGPARLQRQGSDRDGGEAESAHSP